jgi:penicillin-binding protein 1C
VRLGPLPAGLLDPERHQSTLVVDRNGMHLYESLSPAETRSSRVGAAELPPNVVRATIAAEDRRFYRHFGIDPLAIARAVYRNIIGGRVSQGGSTISQQVAKQLLDRPRTLRGKVAEAVLACRLEHRLSKDEILALYLNLVSYGNQYIGIDRASRGYFGTAPSELTVAQAAYLAGLPQRPSHLNPRKGEAGLARQRVVLRRMETAGLISPDEHRRALDEKLSFVADRRAMLAPHFVERVLASFGGRPPAVVRTSLDAELQREVEGIVRMHERQLSRHGAKNVAVVVLENATGGWLAWEGSGDYFSHEREGAIDGVQAPRQPGSALKPFTYALAFERGFSPATVLPDIASHFPTAEKGVLYSPRNYDGIFRGPLRARVALGGSENVPAVWLLSRLEPADLLRLLRRLRFSTFDRTADYYGLGLTLGGAEVRLDELVAAYATFARGGIYLAPSMFPGRAAAGERVFSEKTAFWVSDILSDRQARSFAFGEHSHLDFPFPAAAKTGTSQSYRDNWTIGYTREITVGVWVGNFDRRELRNSSGVTGAAPIFNAVMRAAQARAARSGSGETTHLVPPPFGVEERPVCALSGMHPSSWCHSLEMEWLVPGSGTAECTWHRLGETIWPQEYRSWALQRGLLRRKPVQLASASAHRHDAERLKITNPPDGATYLIDPTLRSTHQTLALRALSNGEVTWSINGRRIGAAAGDGVIDWPLRPGTHRIVATGSGNRSDTATIHVK